MAIPNNLRQAVDDWRAQTVQAVAARFAQVLDLAIPTLMEQSEKARNNDIQAAYFQAQQELRRHAKRVAQQFTQTLTEQMARQPQPAPTAGGGEPDALQLVNPDLFERQVALQNLADRAERDYQELLHELGHRLSVCYRGTAFTAADIPGSPRQLLTALDAGLQQLSIERIARQALAILFDHGVLRHMAPHYARLNDTLRKAGVLPNLKYEVIRHPAGAATEPAKRPHAKPAPSGPAPQQTTTPAATDAEVDRIRALMPGGTARHDSAISLPAAEVAELIHTRLKALDALLPEHGVLTPTTCTLRITPDQLRATQQAMRQQRETIKQEIGPERLSGYDESTIDIVGALFETMLDESDLPATIKALLGHLHTPYLKLGLREPELLSDTDHPARRLLDEMIDAGEAWGHVEVGKGVFPVLQEIVENLRHLETPGHGDLESQRALLAGQIAELVRLRDLHGRRATESEAGRAKLEQARQAADELVQQLVDRAQPCEPCQEFLYGPWLDYLTLQVLRNDGQPGGEHWDAIRYLGDEIAHLSRAVRSPKPPSEEALAQLHQMLLAELGDLAPHYRDKIDALMRGMRALRDMDRDALPAYRPAPRRAKPPTHPEDQLELTPAEARLAAQFAELPEGTQFRLPGKNGGAPRLVTLTWFNPRTRRLLFVDQRGVKSDLLAAAELARLVHTGQAERIEAEREPFITRALQTLRQYLEKSGFIKQEAAHE